MLQIVNQTTKGRELGRYYEYQFQPIDHASYLHFPCQVLSADILEGLEESGKRFKNVMNCIR